MREGWKKVKFSELFNNPKKAIISGPFGSNLKSTEYQSEGVPLVRLQNVDRWKFINKNIIYITSEKAKELSSHSYKSGDILISKLGAPLGKACIAPKSSGEGIVLADIVRVRVDENSHNKDFIVYQLNSEDISAQLRSLTTGATRPRVTLKNVRELSFVIPPLPQQKQIVEILDKAFEKIDKAIANIERNIENAKELFQSQIESRFNSDLSWERINLGDLSKIMYGHTSKVDPNGNCKYLRITDIQDSKVNWDQVPSIKIDEKDFFKYNLNKGDIVFARTGATTGKSYLIKDNPNAVFASYLIRVQINNNNILPEFVYKFFSSREYWRVVKSGISGSAQGGFNASKLSELEIKFPKDIIVQNKVVQEIDIIEKNINTLLSKYHTKLLSLSNLKKSILEKAFKGELTSAA